MGNQAYATPEVLKFLHETQFLVFWLRRQFLLNFQIIERHLYACLISTKKQERDSKLMNFCVLGQDTLLSQCISPPRCKNGYRRMVTLRWTSIPSSGIRYTLLVHCFPARFTDYDYPLPGYFPVLADVSPPLPSGGQCNWKFRGCSVPCHDPAESEQIKEAGETD